MQDSPVPPATRLWLVRHGRVDSAWSGRIYGAHDVCLSSAGRLDAERSARQLVEEPLRAVVSSDLERALHGARCVAHGRDLQVRALRSLREIDRGDWVGLSFAELELRDPDGLAAWRAAPHLHGAPSGENLTQLAQRVLPTLSELAREFAGGAVACVAHSWVIRVAICHALDLCLGESSRMGVAPGSLTALDWPLQEGVRPVLSGLGIDRAPPRSGWSRGPHQAAF